jgi:hypothetical protein
VAGEMTRRAPLTTKQKVLFTTVIACLQIPLIYFISYLVENPGKLFPRQIALVFMINMILMVSLLALITEKCIRKIK